MCNKKVMAVSFAVLLSLTLSLVFPVGVLADDNLPPSPDIPEVAVPPEEIFTEEEEDAVADTADPEPSNTEEPSLIEEDAVISESPDTEEPALAEEMVAPEAETQATFEDTASDANDVPLLNQLPEGTDVVVLNNEGQVIPLVSQEAGAVIASGDPMWCPDGVNPIANTDGCSNGYTSMTALLAALAGANQPTQNGTIWIEKTYDSSTAEPGGTTIISIDGNTFTNWRNNSLTIQGGWDGAGTNTVGGTSLFFDDRFRIINWWNDVTVNDIVIDGGSGGASLEIEIDTPTVPNNYNVTLDTVKIEDNLDSAGAYINNSESTGSVTINNSEFINNGNNDDGLQIVAMGNVSLLNVIATDNGDEGVDVNNTASSSSATVQVLGTNEFSRNTGDGLNIVSDGNITLNNITANANINDGVEINNTSSSTNATVTLTGTNVFTGNTGTGLLIYSDGNVGLNDITADANTSNGVYVENQTSGNGATVTMTGTNNLVGNRSNGLSVRSMGAITLSNIIANGSVVDSGVILDNDEAGAVGGVTINGTNSFSANNDNGLAIDSRGAVSLANVIADGNKTQTGVSIENCNWNGSVCLGSGDVTLTGVLQFTNNGTDGLYINSGGNMSMADVTATGNKDRGAEINNTGSNTSAIVQILGANIFTGNTGDGLNIRSDGNIALNNVTADTNKDNGIDIDNTYGNTNATFTVTGTNNSFSGNTNNGMNVLSEGAITASNLTANGNTLGTGAYLMNDYAGAGGVTITGTNIFNTNYYSGLAIDTRGAVSLDNVTAKDNIRGDGVNIDNCGWLNNTVGCLGSGDVTLIGASAFTNNGNGGDRGLYINSNGNVSMADVTATNNKGNGVEITNISNATSTTSATVQISGTNVFTDNTGTGLLIDSKGNVSLNNVTAGANTGIGVDIENQNGTTTAAVNLTGSNSFVRNTSNGLSVRSKGAITLSNVIANESINDSGAYLRNDYAGAVGGVALTGTNIFNGNRDYGLQILSLGPVSLNNITADNNVLEYGASISNSGTGASGGVAIAGANSFSGNNQYGLSIVSRGAVTLNNIIANGNKTSDGVNINNCIWAGAPTNACLGSGDVTLTGTQTFTNNGDADGDDGLYIGSGSNVILAGVIAKGNKDEGVEIDNRYSTTSATVQIGGTNVFTGNNGTGLLIYSDGVVGLNNVTAGTNGTPTTSGNGVYIENLTSTTNAAVTLTGSNSFVGNRNTGLYVWSKGAITLSDIVANNSVIDNGVWLDNDESGAVGGVAINGTNNIFNGNNDYGLGIYSRGAVSLENITADGNKLEDGVYIDNDAGTGSVTLAGALTFTNNGNGVDDEGLYIITQSNLTLENVTATGNKDEGVEINNTPGTGSVAVTGGNFNQNGGEGMYVRSDGLITLVDVTANQNGGDGANISNDTGGSVPGANVFVIRSTFNSNGDDGLVASSNLDVTLINVTALNNDNDGVELYSDGDNVVLCGGVFSGNDIQVGSTDYNVRVTGGTRTRSGDITVTNWSPASGWTTVANGTGRCNFPDADTDLLPNQWDADDDNDSILDEVDACPVGASAGTDTDGDGCKDNTEDSDDDNDGVADTSDSCPIGASTGTDTDGDGCKDNTEDADDDNDGVLDVNDTFPLDPNESADTDGDGTGNNADTDDDNDTVLDTSDACPIGTSIGTDTDGDGCKNTAEDSDDDNDTVSDTNDACPIGASAGTDTDRDGCKDTGEDSDDDNDGVKDRNDACPVGASIGADTDGDGCKDGEDADDDNDGISDLTEIHLAKVEERHPNGLPGTFSLIPVTGNQATALSCAELSTALEMAGFQVAFDNLCGYSAELGEISESELPGALPDGNKFIGGIGITLLQNGSPVDTMPADTNVTLSFEIPPSLTGETLAILYWNPAAKAWVEKSATADGKLTLATAMPGTFVLVGK